MFVVLKYKNGDETLVNSAAVMHVDRVKRKRPGGIGVEDDGCMVCYGPLPDERVHVQESFAEIETLFKEANEVSF